MIYITGATGFIGQPLCRYLVKAGYAVCAITRRTAEARAILGDAVDIISWDDAGAPDFTFKEDDAIINLAGENVGRGKWTERKKRRILKSRLDASERLVKIVHRSEVKPSVFMQASGVGYYGDAGDEVLTEESPKGSEFLSDIAARAEASAKELEGMGVRVAMLRTAVVLGAGGGALPHMIAPLKSWIGGVPGSGKQFISWIHLDDEVRAIVHVLKNQAIHGPVNLAAPDAVDARTFFRQVGSMLNKPVWLPTPAWALKLFMGQKGRELVLSSKRVVPTKLLESGFEFSHPSLKQALENIFSK